MRASFVSYFFTHTMWTESEEVNENDVVVLLGIKHLFCVQILISIS